jgi:uncharacterized protein YndB with AHSA1/START domain
MSTFMTAMTARLVPAALLAVCLAAPTRAEDARTLVHEAVIPASVEQVWTAFSTSEEAMKWMVKRAEIDLRIGGDMRTSYNAESTLDDEHTIINRIISFEPQRMLSIQNVRAPKAFQNAHLFQQTWSVIYFEPLGPESTKVRSIGMGYGEGPEWDDIYAKFERGNVMVFHALQAHFGGSPGEVLVNPDRAAAHQPVATSGETDRTIALLNTLVGTWMHDGATPEGAPIRVRNIIRPGAAPMSFIMTGELDHGDGFKPHATTLAFRIPDAEGGGIAFTCVDETGGLTRGWLSTSDDGRALIWHWPMTATDGSRQVYHIESEFDGNDRYVSRMSTVDAAGAVAAPFAVIPFDRAREPAAGTK